MRNFIYKIIIIAFLIIVVFEFTIGKRIDPIVQNVDKFSNEQGRKEILNKLRKEMNKGLEKENMLKEEDRILINKFLKKLKSEINSVDENQLGFEVPADTINFEASSKDISRYITSSFGNISKKPLVGLGVVGTKTFTNFLLV